MILISEWVPNPQGRDSEGEWFELWNSGDKAVSLAGWSVKNGKDDAYVIGNRVISPGAYEVFTRAETKLTLRNRDETLSLFDTGGNRAHTSSFRGTAPEGKSYQAVGKTFVFGTPTPGSAYVPAETGSRVQGTATAYNAPLPSSVSGSDIFFLIMGGAAIIATLVFIAVKKHEKLSELIFLGDKKIR